jgi:hypothetical protein
MHNHAEFRRSYRRYCLRYAARILTVFTFGAMVFLVIWLLLEAADRRADPTERADYAMAVAIASSLVAVGLTTRYAGWEARADPLLVCPRCENHLTYYHGIIVLSSGNCPHCGERVLED